MKTPETPIGEPYRIQALRALDLLDTAPEPAFDDIVRIDRVLFSVPTCLVSPIDSDRQWFKASAGPDATETPRAPSFCGHAILGSEVFVVPDALLDERFSDKPLVLGDPFIRFYAGAPIRLPNGYTIGTVRSLGQQPRASFAEDGRGRLDALARVALEAIAVRAPRREPDDERERRQALHRALDGADQPLAVLDAEGSIQAANAAFRANCDGYPAAGVPIAEVLPVEPGTLDPALFDDAAEQVMTLTPAGAERRLAIRIDDTGFLVTGA